MTPDVKGTYLPIGPFNGRPSYQLTGNGWFIWWGGVSLWYLSPNVGALDNVWWERESPNIEGVYLPKGTALEEATVTEIVNKTYEVTGDLTPDATGIYKDAGECNGKRYYEITSTGRFLWWGTNFHWFISTIPGVPAPPGWESEGSEIVADYIPYGGAVGIATVTEI